VELGNLVGWVAFNLYPLVVFEEPLHLPVYETFFDIGLDIRMHAKSNIFFILFNQDIVEVIFNIVDQQYGWPNSAGAKAGGDRKINPYAATCDEYA